MPRHSAGLLLYRRSGSSIQVFLVHPGGPFWKNKDDGSWSIPKGEHEPDDDPIAVALREFEEETGAKPPISVERLMELGSAKQKSGKLIQVWAAEGDFDATSIKSNTFELEWPPKSGKTQAFPEVDRADWFGFAAARRKVLPGHIPFLDRLGEILDVPVEAEDGRSEATAQDEQTTLFEE